MPNLAIWMRRRDEKYFAPLFAKQPGLVVWNARADDVPIEQSHGLLLTGGRDIAPAFLRQPIPEPSPIEKETDPRRDAWEFRAIENAVERGQPIFAICKGMQTLNVALGGTLRLDIAGHNDPVMRDADLQELRVAAGARYRFDRVNSSHHQALDRVADGFEVEAWCAADDVIEQMQLRNYPFAIAVQFHPERGTIYDALFEDFFARLS